MTWKNGGALAGGLQSGTQQCWTQTMVQVRGVREYKTVEQGDIGWLGGACQMVCAACGAHGGMRRPREG